jgi:hypothetical protein
MIAAQTPVVIFALLALSCGAGLATVLFRQQRKTGIYDGIENFRRHINALSPEARRNVVNRHVGSVNPGDNEMNDRR